MKNNDLLKRASALGFPLLDVQEAQNANLTIADIVKSGDLRFWEGFPVILANSAESGMFNIEKTNLCLKKHSDKTCLVSLIVMSLAVYKFFNLHFSWADNFHKSLSGVWKKDFRTLSEKIKKDIDFNITGRRMSVHRLKSAFNNYFNQTKVKLDELLQTKNELSLEYSLSQIFSPKQKELFMKKIRNEKLTKTEREYYSRTVKKKVLALANQELHRLSLKILD